MKYTFTVLLLLIFGISTIAQISHGGKPASFEQTSLKTSIAEYKTPAFDYQKMLKEDLEAGKGKPFRYGKVHDVNLNPENSGSWQTLANGKKIWRLKIKSLGAYSLSLIFNNYRLNKGVELFLYSSDKKVVIGSFNDKNNKKNKWFSTVPIVGDEIIIELNALAKVDYGELNISGIVHDYKGTFGLKTDFGASGSCNVNINCPDGDDWQVEKRSVMKYVINGWLCTGSLINNTANYAKPYVLTAEHCIPTKGAPEATLFIFNYESNDCVASSNPPSNQSISSSSLVSTGGNLDFTLVELSEIPPAAFNVYYAGWNRKTTPATNTTCIHHPQGDIKKISLDYDAPTIKNNVEGYLTDSHWNIAEWDVGTTEGGSSGSPLFDENHLIIGDLTGGDASCSSNFNDYYSRFDLSWDYHSEPGKHLKTWLDPLNSGVQQLEGYDPNGITEGLDAAILNINYPVSEFCSEGEISPTIILENNGIVDLTSALVSYQIDDNPRVFELWNGSLGTNENEEIIFKPIIFPSGEHTFKAFVSSPNGSVDQVRRNDTIVKDVTGYRLIKEVLIEGNPDICLPELKSNHQVLNEGNYLWKVTGGTVIGDDVSQQVEIQWDEWGERYLDVNVSNLCNAVDAETLEINVVEQGFNLTIELDGNGESACWYLKNCDDGSIVAQDCDLPASGIYTTSICISNGCYYFEIYNENAGIKSYSLNRMSDNQVVLSEENVLGSGSFEFYLNPSASNARVNLYPNPADTEVAIEASFVELYEDATFAIFNLKGATLMPYTLFDERKVINISTLQPGFYIVKVKSRYGEFSRKFLKQ